MIKDYFFISVRNITKRKIRSWLTMIGIFIGIAAVVALVSLGQGLREAVVGQFASVGTDKLVVQAAGTGFGPPGSTAVRPLTTDASDVVQKVRGVDQVAERLIRSVRLQFDDEQVFSAATNLPQDEQRDLVIEVMEESMDLEPEAGRQLTKEDKYKIVVGNDFYTKKVFSRKLRLGDKLEISGKDFEIVGFLKRSGSIFGEQIVIMNDEPMREVLDIGNEVDLIAAKVEDTDEIETVAERIEKEMRKHRDVEKGKEDFSVQTPTQAVESLDSILSYVTWFLVFIAMISLIVGGIGIMNTMFTAILERKKEIGIMKSIGARNEAILTMFLIESGALGFIGGIIGVIIGIGLSKSVELIATAALGTQLIQAHYTLTWIIVPLVFAFMVGSLSGVLPALQAAKLNPVDALRK